MSVPPPTVSPVPAAPLPELSAAPSSPSPLPAAPSSLLARPSPLALALSGDSLRHSLASRRGFGLQSDVEIAISLGADDLRPLKDTPLRPAAVLVPLVCRQREDGPGNHWSVLLTRRTDHLHHHAGQISFPGGRQEEEDADAVACALREAEEETGLAASQVEVAGTLDDYVTITAFRVVPVVGIVRPPLKLSPDPFEVAEVFEVPLDFLVDPLNHQRVSRTINGKARPYYALPWQDYYIWGATAGMLINLSRVLAPLAAGETLA